jgi:isoleucyl-tRNA synthetase
VRQPLQKVIIPSAGNGFEQNIRMVQNIIKSETNIKEVELLPANNNFIKKKAKANYKTLGKKLGAKMKWAAAEIQSLNDEQIDKIAEGNFLMNPDFISKKEAAIYLSPEDIEVSTNEIPGFEIAVKGSLTVALDLVLTTQLKDEGFAREFINRIQNIRKENNYELTDKILLIVEDKERVKDIVTEFNEYICAEILADNIEFSENVLNGSTIDVNNDTLTVRVKKKDN